MAVVMTQMFMQPAPIGGKFQQAETTILIIEDDLEMINIVKMTLEDEGYKVLEALNGIQALKIIENVLPAIILLDLRMPIMDGPEFINKLIETGKREYISIILLTAEFRAKEIADDLRADGYLLKPFNLADLLQTIKKFS